VSTMDRCRLHLNSELAREVWRAVLCRHIAGKDGGVGTVNQCAGRLGWFLLRLTRQECMDLFVASDMRLTEPASEELHPPKTEDPADVVFRLRACAKAWPRGGYRDPESQAFIESWFSKLKEREIWRTDYETLADARAGTARYVERYHHRPHQFLGPRTPKEVGQTWEDAQETEAPRNQAA
jgi:hypothetical protein